MNTLRLATLVAFIGCAGTTSAYAQDFRGFVGTGVTSDVNGQHFPGFSGGAVVDLGQPWVSAGAQAETFFSWPYFAGRGSVFAQGNLFPKGKVRPFVLGGFGWGEEGGTLIGAGMEFRPGETGLGLRASIEDYVVRYQGYDRARTGHQVALRVGFLFR